MREIVIISGKGGTGKTSLTGAFAQVARNMVLCDLDVDAPDLHILLAPQVRRKQAFISGHEARIRPEDCTACGLCAELCRFEAIHEGRGKDSGPWVVDPLRCEGCKVCVTQCPAQAIDFPEKHCGDWYISDTRFGPMVHAQLFAGEENSGRLVTLLKQQAKQMAEEQGLSCVLCDGAPGIGCPVISSLSGTHLAVIVTEPTLSGRHDMERVAQLCEHFRIPVAVIVNKSDLNEEQTSLITRYCNEKNYELLACLPHDNLVTEAMVQRKVVTEYPDAPLAEALRQAWRRIETLAGLDGHE